MQTQSHGNPTQSTRNYHYQNGAVLYTDNGSAANTFQVLGAGGNTISTVHPRPSDDEWYLYSSDIRGSVTSLTDEDGDLAAAYEYDEFGETEELTGVDFDNELCYTGQIRDKETGLHYCNARYYDPKYGRFLTQDTYRGEQTDPQTLHLYAYCANDPVNHVDPTGHKYSSQKAVKYARKYAYDHNTKYRLHRYDCTNFVSQCLEEGGLGQNRPYNIDELPKVYDTTSYWYSKKYKGHGRNKNTYWHESTSWIDVNDFYKYWRKNGAKKFKKLTYKQMYKKIKKGDIVQLRESGEKDDPCHHSVIISVAKKKKSKFCAHATNRKDEPIKTLKPGQDSFRIIRPR